MNNQPLPKNNSRIGFSYFPDSVHYRDSDIEAWLPELKSLGASWLVLQAPDTRAIPESFIRKLVRNRIEPIVHFPLSLNDPISPRELKILLSSYQTWGLNYVALFNRPNCHDEWEGSSWVQQDLVERFLDIYLPLAEIICEEGLTPIFPPLEPGGDYWDTAFLRSSLVGIQRRGHGLLLEKLGLGAYAFVNDSNLNWGAGGPERWPGARPYFTPPGEEDHQGFRIFEWYMAIGRAVLGETPPIFVLGGGSQASTTSKEEHASQTFQIAQLMNGEIISDNDGKYFEPVPDKVVCFNFYLLAAAENSPETKHAWYQPDGSTLPIVQEIQSWYSRQEKSTLEKPKAQEPIQHAPPSQKSGIRQPINHYILIPSYEWGIADWHLDITRDFVKKYRATLGFSVDEACRAERVTVIGGEDTFPESIINQLKTAGCFVEQIIGDGTEIASQLEKL